MRRAFSQGVSFDFNYTLSHSIDNASAAEGASGQDGAVIQNIFNPGEFRGSSDFDIRNQVNVDVVYELPVGKGKPFWSSAPGWANEMFGGWQVSSIMRFSSGLPTVIQGNRTWDTNYWQGTLAIPTGPLNTQTGYDSNGNPSLFSNTNAANSFADAYPGNVGTRALIRLAGMKNFDFGVAKSFPLPWEGHRIQFRAEAYNAFNNVNFIQPSLALYNPGTFGEYQNTMPPREMQFALAMNFKRTIHCSDGPGREWRASARHYGPGFHPAIDRWQTRAALQLSRQGTADRQCRQQEYFHAAIPRPGGVV